jgi:FkbM family methyltransferase
MSDPMSDVMPLGHIDTAILRRFTPWSGTIPAGYFAYFLGNLTRADYWAFSPEIRATYDRERFEAFSIPAFDDNIFDWVVLLEAVAAAKNGFTMAAVGAGWGRWLVAAALATKQYNRLPFRLIGVEAEPTHFRWMQEHFRDNGLDPDDHDLIEAAAAGQRGRAWFYVGKPDSWYGQSIIHDERLEGDTARGETSYNGEAARMVRTIDLTELLSDRSPIDYLHMDIQGAELEFLASAPALLHERVKRVLVGTHSTEIEEGLRRLFASIGWQCQYDVPMNGQVVVDATVVTLGDGVQVWLNPAF